MNFMTLDKVGISTPEPLFQNITLRVGQGDRVGLVAGNGRGKSSLLRCIAGVEQPTSGVISLSRGLRVAFVEQTIAHHLLHVTLREAVCSALPNLGAENERWRAEVILDAFQAPANVRDQKIKFLSGGWQRLALLARAWAADPDLMLLDEPTNHLDRDKIEMLEAWIATEMPNMAMLIASHDRRFLDLCTTSTVFLRPEVSKIFAHGYSKAKHLLEEDDRKDAFKLERDVKEVERLRRSAQELRNIGVNSRSDAAQKKSKHMAQRAENLEQSFGVLHKEKSGDLRLQSSVSHARVLVALDDVLVEAPDGHVLYRTGKLKIFQGDRLVLLGANGSGKSQLIGLMRRAFKDPGTIGGIAVSPTAIVGYADQHMSQLPDDKLVFDFIAEAFDIGDQRSRTLLAGAGFPIDHQQRLIGQFSAGQKARLGMLTLRLETPNFYLLDEPTNHVDIAGQEKLEREILDQNATCVIVSHDRAFTTNVGTRWILIEKGRLVEKSLAEIDK